MTTLNTATCHEWNTRNTSVPTRSRALPAMSGSDWVRNRSTSSMSLVTRRSMSPVRR